MVKNDNMPCGNLFACGTCVMAKTAVFSAPFDLCLCFTHRTDSDPKTETGRVSVAAHGRVRTYATTFPVTWQRWIRETVGISWDRRDSKKCKRRPTLGASNLQGVLGQSFLDRGYWQFVKASLNTKKRGWAKGKDNF